MQALIRPGGPSDCVVFCLQSAHAWGFRHKKLRTVRRVGTILLTGRDRQVNGTARSQG